MTTYDRENHPRDGRGKFLRTFRGAERDRKACELRVQGWTVQQVADALFNGNKGNASRAISRTMKEITLEPAEELLTTELLRLDRLIRETERVLQKHHVVVSHGRIMVDPDSGEKLEDSGPVLAAIQTLKSLNESRRKLLGLDAPAQAKIQSNSKVEYIIGGDVDTDKL